MLSLTLLCLFAFAVPFALYPLLLWSHALLAPISVKRGAETPAVDLVICAFNEAEVIEAKLRNALALDYPKEQLTIWVASDGSTDDTVVLCRAFAADGVRVLDLPRAGKAAALNTAVGAGSAPVVAFSDANSQWQPDALRHLVSALSDPRVGGVAGDQQYSATPLPQDAGESAGERSYWQLDRQLKVWQSRAGSAISATGAIYCIRRTLFQPAPMDATDDFMVSTGVIAAGRRLLFLPEAVAVEPPAAAAGLEFRRKVRVISRGLRSVYYRRALLNPFNTGFYALELLVHKLWRRMVWIPLLVLLLTAPVALAHGGLPALTAFGVLVFAAMALTGLLSEKLRRNRLFAIAAYVAIVNAACAVATLNMIRGRRISSWHLPRDAQTHAQGSEESQA